MLRIKAAPTNLVQLVRAHYGLGLAQLAPLLGMSVSLLGQAATNRRELPTAAMLLLLPLAQALPPPWNNGPVDPAPAPPPAIPPAPPLPGAVDLGTLQHRLADAASELTRVGRALDRAQLAATQARRLLAVLPAFEAALPPADSPVGVRARAQLPLVEADAQHALRPRALAAIVLLLARQASLTQEVAWLREWIALPEAGS